MGEDAALSQPASVDLAGIFDAARVNVTECIETTLTGNQPLATAPTVRYPLDDGRVLTLPVMPPPPAGARLTVQLTAMQIRTFVCTVRRSS